MITKQQYYDALIVLDKAKDIINQYNIEESFRETKRKGRYNNDMSYMEYERARDQRLDCMNGCG